TAKRSKGGENRVEGRLGRGRPRPRRGGRRRAPRGPLRRGRSRRRGPGIPTTHGESPGGAGTGVGRRGVTRPAAGREAGSHSVFLRRPWTRPGEAGGGSLPAGSSPTRSTATPRG